VDASLSEFDQFRNALQAAAARSLERTHPEYVVTFQKVISQTGDPSKAFDTVKDISTDKGFTRWRPILTATLDTELAINRLRVALNMLKILPPREVLNLFSMSAGEWVDYQLTNWLFLMKALLEKEKALISKAVRTLVKPSNTQWKDIENSLLKRINALIKDTGKMRDPLAHGGLGGGGVSAVEEERLWEGFVLMRGPLDIRQLLEPMVEYHDKSLQRLRQTSIQALAEINRASEDLSRHIDWDNV
jgi:hypothetical protein